MAMREKASVETTGYDLSSTGTLININSDQLLDVGVHVNAGSATDFAVEVQPEGSTNWYTHAEFTGVATIGDSFTLPDAFRVRLRNTATVADTADAVLGGSD